MRDLIRLAFWSILIGALWFWIMAPAYAQQCGIISWYGAESGHRTASGEYFNGTSLTAAHRTLPLGTYLRVVIGARSVTLRVNDRGPAAWTGASLDVSKAGAARLGLLGPGRARGCWTVISGPHQRGPKPPSQP